MLFKLFIPIALSPFGQYSYYLRLFVINRIDYWDIPVRLLVKSTGYNYTIG